jgi:hypothetical protein
MLMKLTKECKNLFVNRKLGYDVHVGVQPLSIAIHRLRYKSVTCQQYPFDT